MFFTVTRLSDTPKGHCVIHTLITMTFFFFFLSLTKEKGGERFSILSKTILQCQ